MNELIPPARVAYNTADVADSEAFLAIAAFQHSFIGDLYTFELKGDAHESLIHVLKLIMAQVAEIFGKQPELTCLNNTKALLISDHFLLVAEDQSGDTDHFSSVDTTIGDMWVVARRGLTVSGYGSEADIQTIRAAVSVILDQLDQKLPSIRWHYTNRGSTNTQTITFEQPKLAYDEFYPWITEGLTGYIDRFAASDETILVILGEPGTGKTSFIRQMIWRTKWNCAVTYDEGLLKADSLFVDFMTNDKEQMLVIEDADLFLTSRERDRNDMMARFLNVSDGLYKTNKTKKLVFTTNLTQPGQIDNALLREGRCFDCVAFRALSYQEAVRAAEKIGIVSPKEARNYTLAQLFADKKRSSFPGFGMR